MNEYGEFGEFGEFGGFDEFGEFFEFGVYDQCDELDKLFSLNDGIYTVSSRKLSLKLFFGFGPESHPKTLKRVTITKVLHELNPPFELISHTTRDHFESASHCINSNSTQEFN